jgi:hypothetical protein
MLRPDELKKIRRKTVYDDTSEEWQVPAFIFKQKEICFPKLNGPAMMQSALDQRNIEIISPRDGTDDKSNNSTTSSSGQGSN